MTWFNSGLKLRSKPKIFIDSWLQTLTTIKQSQNKNLLVFSGQCSLKSKRIVVCFKATKITAGVYKTWINLTQMEKLCSRLHTYSHCEEESLSPREHTIPIAKGLWARHKPTGPGSVLAVPTSLFPQHKKSRYFSTNNLVKEKKGIWKPSVSFWKKIKGTNIKGCINIQVNQYRWHISSTPVMLFRHSQV